MGALLDRIGNEVRIGSAAGFVGEGGKQIPFQLATTTLYQSDPAAWRKIAAAEIAPFIYARYYLGERGAASRFLQPVPDLTPIHLYGDPGLLARLAAANCGSGYADGGWHLVARDGTGLILEKEGLKLRAEAASVSNPRAALGEPVSVRLPNHRRHMSRGHYTVIPDQGPPTGPAAPLARLYVHVQETSAPRLVAALTDPRGPFRMPFILKVLNNPKDYWRPDSSVLLLSRSDLPQVVRNLAASLSRAGIDVADCIPAFTRRLLAGIAVADEPTDPSRPGVSFGQHRSLLAAEGVVQAFLRPATAGGHLAGAFRANGVDPARPYLNPGAAEFPFEAAQ